MTCLTKWLTDLDAADHPFPYQIDDRFKSATKKVRGTLRNTKAAAP